VSDSASQSWGNWFGPAQPPEAAAVRAKHRLAEAMRQVIERLVTSDAPATELETTAGQLEHFAAELASHSRSPGLWGVPESATSGTVGAFFDLSPLIGRANPLAPPIDLREENGAAVGRVRFGCAYEGPPGCVHGGFIAAAFDEILGFAQSMTGKPGMTGTLRVRYLKPTPLHTPLEFNARIERVEGRKIFTLGSLHAGAELTAEADAIFISVPRERMLALAAARPHP